MAEFANDDFIDNLSSRLTEIQLVEPVVSDGFGIEAAIALAEQQLLSKVLSTVLGFLSDYGVMLPNKQQLLDLIDKAITAEQYHVFPGTTMTVCALQLHNGYIVTGESAAASPENFDKDIGRKIARDNARNKIWALEGYLLREKLAEAA